MRGRLRTADGTSTPGLRLRVAMAVLVLFAVVLTALLAFVNLTLATKLHGDLRSRLLDRAGFAQLIDGTLDAQELADQLTGDGITVRLLTPNGPLTGIEQPRLRPAGNGRPPAAPSPSNATLQTRGDALEVIVDVDEGTLVLSASQANVTATVHRLLMLEILGGLLSLGVLAAALYGTLGFALRPLARITDLATAIAGGEHGRRLRPRQRRTDLGRTAEAFDAMVDELEAAVSDARAAEGRLRAFLADASHELRTPVAGVSASAQLLVADGLDPQTREDVTAGLVMQSQRIARLVDDLVLSARLDEPATALAMADVNLVALAADAAAHLSVIAPGVGIAVRSSGESALVRGDHQRLGQVVANLLDNAVRATPPGGRIAVGIDARPGWVRLIVDDTGPGVPPADRELVFERFVRLDRSTPGSGLGLAISRAVAQAHGGSLSCAAPPDGRGARFVMDLPALDRPSRAHIDDRALAAVAG